MSFPSEESEFGCGFIGRDLKASIQSGNDEDVNNLPEDLPFCIINNLDSGIGSDSKFADL